jgi:hypothetical protein
MAEHPAAPAAAAGPHLVATAALAAVAVILAVTAMMSSEHRIHSMRFDISKDMATKDRFQDIS